MPWKVSDVMDQRHEFVLLASQSGANVRELCRRFGVAAATAYKWLDRFRTDGRAGLCDRSRRPQSSPGQTCASIEQAVLAVRDARPRWGGRKLRDVMINRANEGKLLDAGGARLDAASVPAASTITAILRRRGRLDPRECAKREPWQRFEHAAPNDLWQMDFKGHFPLLRGGRCHPLTVIDDHSRFALGVRACGDETATTVQRELTGIFSVYGLPKRMLMDNGSPWGDEWEQPWTVLTAWLLRLDIAVTHGRPRHPQTQGKNERFNRTLKLEVIDGRTLEDLAMSQTTFDPWRDVYNTERPHEALGMAVPASRYAVSVRPMPPKLPAPEYGPGVTVLRVRGEGKSRFEKREVRIGKAFANQEVGLRPTTTDGVWEAYYGRHPIGELDMRVRDAIPRCRIPSAPVAALPARTESGNAE